MTDSTSPKPDRSEEPTQSVTNISGGVNLGAQHDVTIGGDVVGRDKIINVAPGATLIIGERPVPKEELTPSLIKQQPYEPDMLLIPAGPFLMGSPDIESSETLPREVILSAYYIGKYPITNREYAEYVSREQTRDAPKIGWSGRKPLLDKLDYPVVDVSWHDAVAYCQWLSQQTGRAYRLPTEAEWEKAARGTDGRTYPWGNTWADETCNAGEGERGYIMAVDAHPAGASPYGCQDMVGNVQEWTSTLWGTGDTQVYIYPYQPNDGREDMDNEHLPRPSRVHRGGSYRDDRDNLRCTFRGKASPTSSAKWRGFRVVVEP